MLPGRPVEMRYTMGAILDEYRFQILAGDFGEDLQDKP